jgi:hypothetical protein
MSGTTVLYRLQHCTTLSLCSLLMCGLLARPLPASAEQPTVTAQMVQRQVATLDARFKARKPFLERALDGGENGWDIYAWGAPKAIEKISSKYQGERGEMLYDFYWREGVLIAARLRRVDYGAYLGELPANKHPARNVLEDERFEFADEVVLRRRSFGRTAPVNAVNVNMVLVELKAGALSHKRLMEIPENKENKYGNCTWSCMREQADVCLAYECK